MKDIKCPSCGKTFRIDSSNYDDLLSQIKNEEFKKEVDTRLKFAEADKKKELELTKKEFQLLMADNSRELEKSIIHLESKLSEADQEKVNALKEMKSESEAKINSLNSQISKLQNDITNQAKIEKLSRENEVVNAVKDLEIEKSELLISMEKLKQEVC